MLNSPKSFRKASIAIILLVLAVEGRVWADDTATIRLKSGEVYQDVVPDIFDFYRTILFEYQGQRVSVNFSDIESITDPDGVDITSLLLGTSDDNNCGEDPSSSRERSA